MNIFYNFDLFSNDIVCPRDLPRFPLDRPFHTLNRFARISLGVIAKQLSESATSQMFSRRVEKILCLVLLVGVSMGQLRRKVSLIRTVNVLVTTCGANVEQIEDLKERKNPANAMLLAICRILNCFEKYPAPGSNRDALRHWCLRPTRLPIPPSGHHSGHSR